MTEPSEDKEASRDDVDDLVAPIYEELRAFVDRHMRERERPDHTLRATEVVHDAYIRLCKLDRAWTNHNDLKAMTAKIVRDVLVDHARARRAQKRGGDKERVTLHDFHSVTDNPGQSEVDLLDLDVALKKLAERRPRQAEVVTLRFFGGLTFREIADTMGIAPDTVKEHWTFARALLLRELTRH